MVYRSNKSLKYRQNLEQLAEEEAELELAAQDLELRSQGQAAEVRLRTRGLSDLEREDLEDARKYARELIQQTEKSALERKERWKQRKKLGYKILGITAAVLSLAYGVSRIPAVRATYDSEYAVRYALEERVEEIEERLVKTMNHDCSGGFFNVRNFYDFYKDATGKDFPNPNLNEWWKIKFKIDPAAKSISVSKLKIGSLSSTRYKITLPLQTAEELLQKKNYCEF